MKRIFSIVVPIYQNELNIPSTVPRLLALQNSLDQWDMDLELIFVDDGSRDQSYNLLEEFQSRHPEAIKLVKLTKNFGQTPATQAGLQHATGDCIGVISADLQEPCEMFIEMIKVWTEGAKFVIGERQIREELWWHRKVSGIYWSLIRRHAFSDFPDMGYDFCLLDRQVVDDINKINEKNSSIFVLIYWFGYKAVRIPITRKIREKGSSQWRLLTKIRFTLDTLIGFTYLPSRFITVMSLSASVVAMFFLLFLLYRWYITGAAPAGWMTVVGLLLILGSLILFSLGIISEYLLRILDESRKRPAYVLEKIVVGRSNE
ncbi:glycosyltransferase family 2 protein [Polaromonas sp. YR568]|uniref:glycosyltransferase family 2 protein n=1 Tax=Polaromonas sp. YR568 TaxID=1855301 RepID=UPI00313832F0